MLEMVQGRPGSSSFIERRTSAGGGFWRGRFRAVTREAVSAAIGNDKARSSDRPSGARLRRLGGKHCRAVMQHGRGARTATATNSSFPALEAEVLKEGRSGENRSTRRGNAAGGSRGMTPRSTRSTKA